MNIISSFMLGFGTFGFIQSVKVEDYSVRIGVLVFSTFLLIGSFALNHFKNKKLRKELMI